LTSSDHHALGGAGERVQRAGEPAPQSTRPKQGQEDLPWPLPLAQQEGQPRGRPDWGEPPEARAGAGFASAMVGFHSNQEIPSQLAALTATERVVSHCQVGSAEATSSRASGLEVHHPSPGSVALGRPSVRDQENVSSERSILSGLSFSRQPDAGILC
jgi:hypothetical protein